jgi:hypothetical protein
MYTQSSYIPHGVVICHYSVATSSSKTKQQQQQRQQWQPGVAPTPTATCGVDELEDRCNRPPFPHPPPLSLSFLTTSPLLRSCKFYTHTAAAADASAVTAAATSAATVHQYSAGSRGVYSWTTGAIVLLPLTLVQTLPLSVIALVHRALAMYRHNNQPQKQRHKNDSW